MKIIKYLNYFIKYKKSVLLIDADKTHIKDILKLHFANDFIKFTEPKVNPITATGIIYSIKTMQSSNNLCFLKKLYIPE